MVAVAVKQQSPSRKRQRSATEAQLETTAIIQPPFKRIRSHPQRDQSEKTAYWDSLSKLWLTRSALGELNRRNRQAIHPVKHVSRPDRDPAVIEEGLRNPSAHLKHFARHGGPDTTDLIGYLPPLSPESSEDIMPLSRTAPRTKPKSKSSATTQRKTGSTSKTKKTSPYDPNFEQHIIDNGIFPSGCKLPNGRLPSTPKNLDEILRKLQEPRGSLSPSQCSQDDFDTFVRTNDMASNEDAVMCDVFPLIRGNASIPSAQNLIFRNLEPLTQGNIVDAKPDFYDGIHPVYIDRRLREQFGSFIIPSVQSQAPALPNYFLEAKGHDGSGAVAKRQACYHGAIGERGFLKLGAVGVDDSTELLKNNAHTITSTYNSSAGTLQMYAIHQHPPGYPTESPEYIMTRLRSFAMLDTAERFREGAAAFRNGRDWAKKQRDDLIANVNRHINSTSGVTSTIDTSPTSFQSTIEPPALSTSETSEDTSDQEAIQAHESSTKRLKTDSKEPSPSHQYWTRRKKANLRTRSRSRSSGGLLQK